MREKITAFRELTANCGGHCGGRQSPNRAVRGGTGESLGHCGRKQKRISPARRGQASWKGKPCSSSSHLVSDLPLNLWSLSLEGTYQTPTSCCTFFCNWIALNPIQSFPKKVYLDPTSFQEKNVRHSPMQQYQEAWSRQCKPSVNQFDSHPSSSHHSSLPDAEPSFFTWLGPLTPLRRHVVPRAHCFLTTAERSFPFPHQAIGSRQYQPLSELFTSVPLPTSQSKTNHSLLLTCSVASSHCHPSFCLLMAFRYGH